MAKPKKKLSAADQSRLDYRLLRLSLPRATPDAPELHPDNPLLPDTSDDHSNKLHRNYQGHDLKTNMPEFSGASEPVPKFAQLLWDGQPAGSRIDLGRPAIPSASFPIELVLPAGFTTTEGAHELSYKVTIGGNPEDSNRLPIYIDRTPPNNNAAGAEVTLPAEVELNGITKDYLDTHGSVAITVPGGYADEKINDVVEVFIGPSIPAAKLIGSFTRTALADPIVVPLTEDQLEGYEGAQRIFYKLADRSGNTGSHSEYKSVEVTLKPGPKNLQPPTVPLAPDAPGGGADTLIDLKDAYAGVTVQVDDYDVLEAGDQLEVTWDGESQSGIDISGFPAFSRVIPLSVLRGTPPDEGMKTVHVTYAILRDGKRYAEPTGIDIDVDLRKPGPDKPDPTDPDPINPNLPPVTVQGGDTTDENMLRPDDELYPVTAWLEIYDERKLGDVIQLYWKDVPVPAAIPENDGGTYTVTGLETANQRIEFTVPWAIIDAAGNDSALPVHYVVSHDVNDNVDTSVATLVDVLITTITLPSAEFQHLDTSVAPNWFNCSSVREVTGQGWVAEIFVSGGEPQLAGQTLTFVYQGWEDEAATLPKLGTEATVTKTPTQDEADNGFVVYLPYEPLRLTSYAFGTIHYSALISGHTAVSDPHLIEVYLHLAGGGTCSVVGP